MNPRTKRPVGITIIALILLWIGVIGTLIFPLMILVGGMSGIIARLFEEELYVSRVLSIALASLISILWYAMYVFYAWLGYGLWKLRRKALQGAILMQWIAIAMAVVVGIVAAYWQPVLAFGTCIFLAGFYAAILWYLKRPVVQQAFGIVPVSSIVGENSRPAQNTWVKVAVGAAIVLAIGGIFAGCLLYTINKMMRSSKPYQMAMDKATASPCVVAKLGTPLLSKGMISGNLEEGPSDGSADLDIPLTGPKGKGSLHVEAELLDSVWNLKDLTLAYSEGQIHLVPDASPCE